MKKLKVSKKETELIKEKYPNEAQHVSGQIKKLPDDNHFRDMDITEIRQRFLEFSVLMKLLYNSIDLGRNASPEEFAKRMSDISYAAHQDFPEESPEEEHL